MTKQLKTKGKMRQRSLFVDERSLFEKLCDQSNLEAGFKAVKKNRGAPGIDGVTIKEFESRPENGIGFHFING
jgi:hypothetical protein